MAPGNNERHPSHTGTIPKTKVRNNCNVPQEAVTPTRRDMTTNLVTTSLDWVPVSEYNTRTNYSQTRRQANNTSDHELTDLDNSVSFESGFGRFVPVRPQPRALPLNVQNRENLTAESHDDGAGSSISGHTLQPYAHQMQNGLTPHSNHAAAAVMIVNPTTPNAVTGNVSQPFNTPNQNRNNLTRNLNPARNNFEGNNNSSNNNTTPPTSNSRTGTKTVNLINNMYDQAQGSFNNINESNHIHRESARVLGEAIVAACPDAVAVERRLGQIREYIRVTSSLVDTMRNSEDEAFIEHTKEEYDELRDMVMQLKESENKLESILVENRPENVEVPAEETSLPAIAVQANDVVEINEETSQHSVNHDKNFNIKNNTDNTLINNHLKKVTNLENEQLNKCMQNIKADEEVQSQEGNTQNDAVIVPIHEQPASTSERVEENNIVEVNNDSQKEPDDKDCDLNEALRKNILSCVEKVALIEEMKHIKNDQDVVTRPVSAQSNGSTYSENELWQNEIKNKMELSQMRLVALKQQQKRLLKYQEEAKQQLDEINRERSQDIQPSTSHDNFTAMQNQAFSGNYQQNRMYAANQIGVATTLPHSTETLHQPNASNNVEHDLALSNHSTHSQDDRFSHREAMAMASGEEAAGGNHDSEPEDDELMLNERGRLLQHKLRELQLKKQHMETLVSEFQKLQMATSLAAGHNTYSSSGEDSADDEPERKCNTGGNMKNEDPFKMMEIKAIKTALQKTKDLMRSVENYEAEQLAGGNDDSFREMASHSNIHDNKSEGGGSMGGWSNDGSMCRVRNTLPQRHKFTNERHSQQQSLHPHHGSQQHLHQTTQQHLHQATQQHLHQGPQQHPQQLPQHPNQGHQHPNQGHQHPNETHQHPNEGHQHLNQGHQNPHQVHQHSNQGHQLQHQVPQQHIHQVPQLLQHQQQSHEANLASLQELAQELRMETEKIMGERARIKDMISNKEVSRKQKKVNEEIRPGPSGMSGRAPGPAELRQMQLRALLADKQRELDALLNKEDVLSSTVEVQNVKPDSRTASVVNQSYNSEQEEPDSRSEQMLLGSQNSRETENFRGGGDNASGPRSISAIPSHLGSTYGSDSDTTSRNKSNQRNRSRRRQTQERQSEENSASQSNNATQSARHEPRPESTNVNMVPPISQNSDNTTNMPYPHLPPPCWSNTKSNQDMRTNQFTQNSHSQTMERLLGTPQMPFPPSVPFNMMMPYAGVVGGCGCGCNFWGAWSWHQLALQQREIHALREQMAHLEERWRAETASHTLNNQVPPGNRANNYWDNFRSYSRQNLLSASSKANAEGQRAHSPAPLAGRAHNALRRGPRPAPPTPTPRHNQDTRHNQDVRRNVSYERSLSFSSAPDVLNVNQNPDADTTRNIDEANSANLSNININRHETPANSFRNLNITNPIPEIIQSHSNNLNTSANSKKKSSSKLPAKNSTNRRNFSLDYSQTSNINIASTSEAPNPNLASTSRQVQDKAASKLFDLLRENVYSEVTALIGVNESHPDFLIQLFKELQLISSDSLRQKVLQSVRNVLSQYNPIAEGHSNESIEENRTDPVSTTTGDNSYNDGHIIPNIMGNTVQMDNNIFRFLTINSNEVCSSDFLEDLAMIIVNNAPRANQQSKIRVLELLSKYIGMRVCDMSNDIIENLPLFISGRECGTGDLTESSALQDVAGSLNLFSSSDSQLHQLNTCPYEDIWTTPMNMDTESSDLNDRPRSADDDKVDLINCSEMRNGDLAEADQTCPGDVGHNIQNGHDDVGINAEALPDVVDNEEATISEAEAEWLGLDRVPTRLHMGEASEKQKD